MKKSFFVLLCLIFVAKINAQNTNFNNVSIGTDSPGFGVKIKANFPNFNGGWSRSFSVVNENDTKNFIVLGSFGGVTNGVASLAYSFIGKDWNDTYLTFLESGKVGIGTTNPNSRLDLGSGYGTNGAKLLIYNDDTASELSGTKMGFYIDNFTSNNLNLVFPEAISYPGLFTISAKNTSNTTLKPYFAIAGLTGNVGIGTTNPQNKLDVKGTIRSQEVKVTLDGWSDFVFKKEYDLPTLAEVEKHIKEKGHLENIPSEKEVLENGISLGEMNAKLLQKIEELTLYSIQQSKEIEVLKEENKSFKTLAERLSKIEQKIK